jgi:hypothetical protein
MNNEREKIKENVVFIHNGKKKKPEQALGWLWRYKEGTCYLFSK